MTLIGGAKYSFQEIGVTVEMRVERWQFTGQQINDFPAWVIFLNFARDDKQVKILQLEGWLTLNIGDTLVRRTDGFMWVEKAK